MAETIHDLLRALHIATGFVGLAAFWIPVCARKGGRLHVGAGRVFAWCAYAVALTAIGSTSWALLHPSSWAGRPGTVSLAEVPASEIMFVAILGFLGIVLLASVEWGLRATRTRHQPDQFAGWRLRVLSLAQVAAGVALFVFGLFHVVRSGGLFLIPMALGAFGIAGYFDDRRFLANPRPTPMAWWYKHMETMGGAGIAFHTAFFIFGGQRLFDGVLLQGAWSFLPWILPAAIGIPALHLWTRYYRRRFGELPEQVAMPGARTR